MQVWSLGWEDPLEKKMATTPVLLPGKSHGKRSLGLQRVRHNLENNNKGLQNETKQIVGVRTVGLRLQLMVRVVWKVLVAQLCPTSCNPMDCSLSGSSIYGISQARILEWVAISISRGSSWTGDRILHCRQILYLLSHQGNPCDQDNITGKTWSWWESKASMLRGQTAFQAEAAVDAKALG